MSYCEKVKLPNRKVSQYFSKTPFENEMPILAFKCKLILERLGTRFPIQGSALTYHTPTATISHSQTNFS